MSKLTIETNDSDLIGRLVALALSGDPTTTITVDQPPRNPLAATAAANVNPLVAAVDVFFDDYGDDLPHSTIPAMRVDHGMTVRCPDGHSGLLGSVHYSGDVDGNGISTLCFVTGDQWQGSSDTPITVFAVTLDEV